MKKNAWILMCAVALIAIIGCSKDVDSDIAQFAGLWTVDEIFLEDGTATFEIGDTTITGEYSLVGKDINTILRLNEDMTMSSDGQYIAETSYTILNETFENEVPSSDFGGRGTWYMNGNQIIIEQDTQFHTLDILSMRNDTLSVFFPLTLTIRDEDIVSEFAGTLNYKLSR